MAMSFFFPRSRHPSILMLKASFLSLFSRTATPSQSFSSSATTSKPSNPNQSESASRFLLNDLGFSSSEISKIQNTYPTFFRTEAPLKRSVEAVQLFRSYAFTDDQLRHLFVKSPNIFAFRADEVIKPRLELLKSLEIPNEELARTVSRAPRMLCLKYLERNIGFYRSLFHGNVNLMKALRSSRSLLCGKPETADEQLKFLDQCGFSKESVIHIITQRPVALCRTTEAAQVRMEFLRNIGYAESDRACAFAFKTVIDCSMDKLNEKLKHFASLGLSDEQVKLMVRKCPMVLKNSHEKIERVMGYLLSNGVKVGILMEHPLICGMNLEKRIMPRHRAFVFLSETQVSGEVPRLSRILQMTEKAFMKKFVQGNPDGKKLWKIYTSAPQVIPQLSYDSLSLLQ